MGEYIGLEIQMHKDESEEPRVIRIITHEEGNNILKYKTKLVTFGH